MEKQLLLRHPIVGNRAREEFTFRQGAKAQRSLVEYKFEQRSMNVNFSSEFSTLGHRSNIQANPGFHRLKTGVL